VPDLRGRVPVGFDSGNGPGRMTNSASGGLSASALGNTGGEQAHTLTTNELASHTHANTLGDPGHSHGVPYDNAVGLGSGGQTTYDGGTRNVTNNTDAASTGITISNAAQGGGASHNTVPPGIILNYIIKT
jgi:microcystin-dependent protein